MPSFDQAFERYIGRNSPAYVERMKFTPAEACALIRRAGGLPVLAHPVYFDRYGAIKSPFNLDAMLPELIGAGLVGLEVYYPRYDAVTIEYLMAVAAALRIAAHRRHRFPRHPRQRARSGRRLRADEGGTAAARVGVWRDQRDPKPNRNKTGDRYTVEPDTRDRLKLLADCRESRLATCAAISLADYAIYAR